MWIKDQVSTRRKARVLQNNVIYKIFKGTELVKGSLAWGRRVDRQLFQIFEKAFDRKHIIYVLVNRAGPKVENSQVDSHYWNYSNIGGKTLGRITNGSSQEQFAAQAEWPSTKNHVERISFLDKSVH